MAKGPSGPQGGTGISEASPPSLLSYPPGHSQGKCEKDTYYGELSLTSIERLYKTIINEKQHITGPVVV